MDEYGSDSLDLVIYVCGSERIAERLFRECAEKYNGKTNRQLREVEWIMGRQRFRYVSEENPKFVEGLIATIYFHSSSKVRRWINMQIACGMDIKTHSRTSTAQTR